MKTTTPTKKSHANVAFVVAKDARQGNVTTALARLLVSLGRQLEREGTRTTTR